MSGALAVGASVESGEAFGLPPELATQATAILGIRGSGKTVTATVLVEELLKMGQQVVVIDPTDVWWGLKSSGDGTEEGFPVVVLGGPHGDLPLEEENAQALADFAVEQRIPLVLSLRHLRKNAQRRFVTEFCEQLYHRKGEAQHRTPLLVAMDEASAFVPQKVGGAEARMVGAVEDLVRRGRAAGIGVALVDQRPASLNKDVLTQVEVLVSHQVTSPQDSKALDDWVRQHDTEGHRTTFLAGLPSLPRGTAWFWSPALDVFEKVGVRMRETYDSSRTPKLGEDPEPPAAWAEVDIGALHALLETSDEEEDADDDRETLRARIRQLEGDLEASRREALEAPAGEASVNPDLEGRVEDLEDALREAAGYVDQLRVFVSAAEAALRSAGVPEIPSQAQPTPTPVPKEPADTSSRTPPRASVPGLSATKMRIVGTLSDLAELGVDRVPRANLAVLAGQGPRSSAFREHLANLRDEGLVTYPSAGHVELTSAGWELTDTGTRRPVTQEAMQEAWLSYLPGASSRILAEVIRRGPGGSVGREDLARAAGQSHRSSSFRDHLAELKTLGVIEYPAAGRVRATRLLFPEGLS